MPVSMRDYLLHKDDLKSFLESRKTVALKVVQPEPKKTPLKDPFPPRIRDYKAEAQEWEDFARTEERNLEAGFCHSGESEYWAKRRAKNYRAKAKGAWSAYRRNS